ncbi:hypothetical protein [Nonomuraea gerenzanensis]|uniref:hypothetical protein n=1 Tax=Nonomuraea gerenzanensis TaxID=93944 RepID=UPI001CD99C55|nr:hypothetical protein [Nonomuraea gerenzanensis]UBU16651.1 hypothetical protein LCN96_17025 [Nonomuraea gerenzanensis]
MTVQEPDLQDQQKLLDQLNEDEPEDELDPTTQRLITALGCTICAIIVIPLLVHRERIIDAALTWLNELGSLHWLGASGEYTLRIILTPKGEEAVFWAILVVPMLVVFSLWDHIQTFRRAQRHASLLRKADKVHNLQAKIVIDARHSTDRINYDLRRRKAELRKTMAATQEALEKLEHYQNLIELSDENAERVREILKIEARAERLLQWRMFGAGLIISAMLSVPIGIWVNIIS